MLPSLAVSRILLLLHVPSNCTSRYIHSRKRGRGGDSVHERNKGPIRAAGVGICKKTDENHHFNRDYYQSHQRVPDCVDFNHLRVIMIKSTRFGQINQ